LAFVITTVNEGKPRGIDLSISGWIILLIGGYSHSHASASARGKLKAFILSRRGGAAHTVAGSLRGYGLGIECRMDRSSGSRALVARRF
jgi:hypothetical protein